MSHLRAALDIELVRRHGFKAFAARAWSQVEPAERVHGWHHDAMAEHLEAWLRDEITDLVINIPPGMSKTLYTSILFAAYVWTVKPDWRWITASYDQRLAEKAARKHRELVASDWWASRWPGIAIPSGAGVSVAVGYFENNRGGSRFTTTPGGSVTGQHADGHLIDDPHDPKGVASEAELEATLEWWRSTMPTRFRDLKHPRRILVMQRLHERDLTAEMVREGATVLCLPMRYDRDHPHRWASDPRRVEGELLFPERSPEDAVKRLEEQLKERGTASQLQQRPAPKGGAIFRRDRARYWKEFPCGLTRWGISCDLAFKATADGSWVVMQVWARVGTAHYLIGQVRERLDFDGSIKALLALVSRYPQATLKLVEAKANGPALVSALRNRVSGLVLVEPDGGKTARAWAAQPLWEAGDVWLPHPEEAVYPDGRKGAAWVHGLVEELVGFPAAAHDDQVDTLTQWLNHQGTAGGTTSGKVNL